MPATPAPQAGPVRTCVGCRRTDTPAAMVRHVLVEGRVVADPSGCEPGRGAWVHDDPQCLRRALAGGFARSFRGRVDTSGLSR